MDEATGSSAASSCDLVISEFIPNTTSDDLKFDRDIRLVDSQPQRQQYYLPDNCQLNVYKRNKAIDRLYKIEIQNEKREILRCEIRGQMSRRALVQIVRFLGFYTCRTDPSNEWEMSLEAARPASQGVPLLQDISKMALLGEVCSRMDFESPEELQGVLSDFLTIPKPTDLLFRLKGRPKFDQKGMDITKFLSRVLHGTKWHLQALHQKYKREEC